MLVFKRGHYPIIEDYAYDLPDLITGGVPCQPASTLDQAGHRTRSLLCGEAVHGLGGDGVGLGLAGSDDAESHALAAGLVLDIRRLASRNRSQTLYLSAFSVNENKSK